MTAQEYFSIDAINASFLKACHFGAYQGYKFLHEPTFESDAMAFGSAVHAALLEPELFKSEYVICPLDAPKKPTKAQLEAKKPSEKTLEAIAWWDKFNKETLGKKVLDPDESAKISKIRERCFAIDQVKSALETFDKESTFLWDDKDLGKCKAKLDLVDVDNEVVIDVKTTRSADQREFISQMLALRYDIQFAHYCKAVAPNAECFVIAIETDSAEVALYRITDIVHSTFTKMRYAQAAKTALEVKKMSTCPPKYIPEIIDLKLPEWAMKEVI